MSNQATMQVPSIDEQSAQWNRERTKAFCIVAGLAVLFATLWPFNPFPRNHVTWLHGTRGLNFKEAGLVTSSQDLKPAAAPPTESYSLELLLRPATTKSQSTMLAFYVPTHPKQLMVRQHKDSLQVTHDWAAEPDPTETINFDVGHFFRAGRLALVTIAGGSNGTTVYLDGQPAGHFPRFKILPNEVSGEIILGTSAVNYAPWAGEVRGLAIYSKELPPADVLRHYQEWTDTSRPQGLEGAMALYTFSEGSGHGVVNQVAGGPPLEIPNNFSVPHKDFLRSPRREFRTNWRYAKDLVDNILGFIPLGFLVCAYFASTKKRWEASVLAVMSCGTLSCVIEVLQYYVPRRGSGITDIITNTLGAAIGATFTYAAAGRHALERIKLIRPFNAGK